MEVVLLSIAAFKTLGISLTTFHSRPKQTDIQTDEHRALKSDKTLLQSYVWYIFKYGVSG